MTLTLAEAAAHLKDRGRSEATLRYVRQKSGALVRVPLGPHERHPFRGGMVLQ